MWVRPREYACVRICVSVWCACVHVQAFALEYLQETCPVRTSRAKTAAAVLLWQEAECHVPVRLATVVISVNYVRFISVVKSQNAVIEF